MAFPHARAHCPAGPRFFRERARAGYRAEHITSIARRVAAGELDLEALRPGPPHALDEEEAYARLLALPGVGPYAAAHAMMLMGRHSRLVLDSWSRPAYWALAGRKLTDDADTAALSSAGRVRRSGVLAGRHEELDRATHREPVPPCRARIVRAQTTLP